MFPLIGIGYFAVATIPLMVYDIRERRLPNKITVPGLIVTVLGLALTLEWMKFLTALAIAIVLFGLGLLLSLRGWIGMGDVKLFASLSLLLAWFDPALLWKATLWAFGIATVFVLVGMLIKKMTARSTIALGPYLLVGFWVVVTQPAWSSIAR